jgi:copper chaperone NosL
MQRILLAAVMLTMTSCQSRPPQPVEIEAHDMCSSCRMAISQKQFAAQLFDSEETVHKFDDIACMLRFMKQREVEPAAVFVADYETREWIHGNSALFVRTDKIDSPMGGGLLAFSDGARADAAARKLGSPVLRPDEVGLP